MAERQEMPAGNPVNDLMAEGEAHDLAQESAGPDAGFDFEALDKSVSPLVYDNVETPPMQEESPQEVTSQPQMQAGPESQNNKWESEDNPYKKRYSDSSREIQKIKNEQKELTPFVPVLEAMKRDSGLVDHVREYLENGGEPSKSIQDKLDLPEDFMYDQHEAMTDPKSDSAKLMNAHIESAVQGRVKNVLDEEKRHAMAARKKLEAKKEVDDFRAKKNISEDEYNEMVDWAQNHKLSVEDIYYLKNRGSASKNTAEATKKDMMSQMERVQSFPTTTAGMNSERVEKNPDETMFESLLDLDDKDNLFG